MLLVVGTDATMARAASEYFALDEGFWNTSTILEVCVERGRTSYSSSTKCLVFDDRGGALLAADGQVAGTSVDGNEISVALDEVSMVKVTLASKAGFEAVQLRLDALKSGTSWRPRGVIKQAFLSTGEILRFDGMTPVLDVERRLIFWTRTGETPVEIHFRDLLCIQIEPNSGYGKPVHEHRSYFNG